jgi:hypothetical protein
LRSKTAPNSKHIITLDLSHYWVLVNPRRTLIKGGGKEGGREGGTEKEGGRGERQRETERQTHTQTLLGSQLHSQPPSLGVGEGE